MSVLRRHRINRRFQSVVDLALGQGFSQLFHSVRSDSRPAWKIQRFKLCQNGEAIQTGIADVGAAEVEPFESTKSGDACEGIVRDSFTEIQAQMLKLAEMG